MVNDDKQERLHAVLDYLKSIGRCHVQADLARAIKRSTGAVSKAMNGDKNYLTGGLFSQIALAYPDVFNRNWLLHGDGEMLLRKASAIDGGNGGGTADNFDSQNGCGQSSIETEKDNQKQSVAPVGPIIELYAQLIKQVEAELAEVRSLRTTLEGELEKISQTRTALAVAASQMAEARDDYRQTTQLLGSIMDEVRQYHGDGIAIAAEERSQRDEAISKDTSDKSGGKPLYTARGRKAVSGVRKSTRKDVENSTQSDKLP